EGGGPRTGFRGSADVPCRSEASIAAREESLERECRQMNDLYASLQAETEKISGAREVFDTRLADAERRERELILREQASGEGEGRLRQYDAAVSAREKTVGDREKAMESRSKDLERREAKIAAEGAALAKREEALDGQGTTLEDRRDELARATERMEKIAK